MNSGIWVRSLKHRYCSNESLIGACAMVDAWYQRYCPDDREGYQSQCGDAPGCGEISQFEAGNIRSKCPYQHNVRSRECYEILNCFCIQGFSRISIEHERFTFSRLHHRPYQFECVTVSRLRHRPTRDTRPTRDRHETDTNHALEHNRYIQSVWLEDRWAKKKNRNVEHARL